MALNQTNKARVDCAETCAAIALKILTHSKLGFD